MASHGDRITPRDKNYKPSSAFDVKKIKTNNFEKISNYLTKYVSKNKDEFECQVWNCSKGISRLYTDFYSDYSFIIQMEKLINKPLKFKEYEYCKVYYVPINEETIKKYKVLKEKNNKIWEN